MKRQIINFKNKLSSYSIIIGENALDQLTKKISILCPKTRKIALIIDENVPVKFKNKFKKKLPVRTVQIEAIKKNENNCIIKSYSNFMYKILQNMIN